LGGSSGRSWQSISSWSSESFNIIQTEAVALPHFRWFWDSFEYTSWQESWQSEQQDYMAASDPGFTLNLSDALKLRKDYGFFNINFDTARAMNKKYNLGAGDTRGIINDLIDPKRAVRYAAAYMKEVKANLDPHLSRVSPHDRIGEYVQGWRQGYERRIASYTPGGIPRHGMFNYNARVNEVVRILWNH